MTLYVCDKCGHLGPMADFQSDCKPGWTHGRLIRVVEDHHVHRYKPVVMMGGGLEVQRCRCGDERWWDYAEADDRPVENERLREALRMAERGLADAERIIESRTGPGSWVGSLNLAGVRDVLAEPTGHTSQ